MRVERLLVLARARVLAQRLRLYPGQLDHLKQRSGHGRGIEVIEEHREVGLAVDGGQGAGGKRRDAGAGAMDVERERAKLAKPELHQDAQPVHRRVQRFVPEDVDGRGQVYAATVGNVCIAHLEMAVAAGDSLREQREGTFDIGEVDHELVWWPKAGSRRRCRRPPSARSHRRTPSALSQSPRRGAGRCHAG